MCCKWPRDIDANFIFSDIYSWSLEDFLPANLSNNNLVFISEWNCPHQIIWDSIHYSKMLCYLGTDWFVNKHWGLNNNQGEGNLYYRLDEIDDTLIMIPSNDVEYCFEKPHGLIYVE